MRPRSSSGPFQALIWTALIAALCNASAVAAQPNVSTIPRTVNYQGYLESSGSPFDGVADFKFVISCGGSVTAWSNDGSSASVSEPTSSVPVQVSAGGFSVALGDTLQGMPLIEPESFSGCTFVNLHVWVDTGSGFEALPAQAVLSSFFALEADAAYRGIGGFIVDQGALIVTDDQDQQVIQLVPYDVGLLDGPSLLMANQTGAATVSLVGDVGSSGAPELRLFDNLGNETIGIDGASGEMRISSLRFDDDTVQTTAGGGGAADNDWTVSGDDMYSVPSGNIGMGTNNPGSHVTISRPAQAQEHQLELRVESNITAPNYDGILFSQGATGSTTLGEMRLEYNNNGTPDLSFHLRNQNDILFLEGSSGQVGVGTADPTAPLEVTGTETQILYVRQEADLGADAAIAIRGSRNGTTTANVASIEFRDWDNNEGVGTDFLMARIAAGMADPSGQTGYLRFNTNNGSGEVERVRIDKLGNVGIGTTSPSAKLDVAGDVNVSGSINVGSVNVGSMTRYLAVSAAAFSPELDTMNYKNNGVDLYGTTPDQLVRFRAPVNLPHGATITECRLVFDDNHASTGYDVTLYLMEWPHFGGSGSILAHLFSVGGPGTYQQLSTALSTNVDNQNNHYYLTVDWDVPNSGNVWDIRLRSVRITYEISELAP